MERFMPYAVLCGVIALISFFFSRLVFFIAGGICTAYFFWFFCGK